MRFLLLGPIPRSLESTQSGSICLRSSCNIGRMPDPAVPILHVFQHMTLKDRARGALVCKVPCCSFPFSNIHCEFLQLLLFIKLCLISAVRIHPSKEVILPSFVRRHGIRSYSILLCGNPLIYEAVKILSRLSSISVTAMLLQRL